MVSKIKSNNPLKVLFILIYKTYEGKKSEGGIEFFSSTCFFLAIVYMLLLAFLEFFGLREYFFGGLLSQNELIIFIVCSSIAGISYLILKKWIDENAIKQILFTKKDIFRSNLIIWACLIFSVFLGIIANNYNRCNRLSIKPGYGYTEINPRCCELCK